MQPNSQNKKIPEVRPYGVKTWGVERQISGSSYDFIRKPLSNLPNFHLSPSFQTPPTPFLTGPTQEARLHLWLDEVFPWTHVFLTPWMDLAPALFLPEVSLAFPLLVLSVQAHLFFIFPTSPVEGKPWRKSNARQFCLLGSKITVVSVILAIVTRQQIMQRGIKRGRDRTKELANLMGIAAGPCLAL